jgi:hypothetical protein
MTEQHSRRVRTKPAGETGVPTASPGIKVDAGTSSQCGLDETLIQDAADDAHKLGAWQAYAKQNHLPVMGE